MNGQQNQEKELAAANAALQIHKIKLAEMTEEVNRMKETLSKGESKYNEVGNRHVFKYYDVKF